MKVRFDLERGNGMKECKAYIFSEEEAQEKLREVLDDDTIIPNYGKIRLEESARA